MKPRYTCAACFLVVAFVATPGVCAEPPESVQFTLVRGPIADKRCPTQARVMHDIRRQIAHPNVFAPNADWSFEVIVTFHHGRFHARIEEQHAGRPSTSLPSETEIPGGARDCEPLAKWIALTIARLIDPAATPPPTTLPRAPATTKRRKTTLWSPKPEPVKPEIPISAIKPTEALTIDVATRGGVGWGLVPGIAPELSIFSSIGRGRVDGMFGLSWTPTTTLTVPVGKTNVSYAFGMNIAWLGGCFHALKTPRFVASGCAGGAAGIIHAAVTSIDAAQPADVGERSWFGASIAPRLRVFPWQHLFVEAGANMVLTLHRRTYTACPLEDCPGGVQETLVFAQSWVAVSGFFGVGMSIP